MWTASSRTFDRLRQAEVQHLHGSVVSQLDIRRLQIAVNDSLVVRRFERIGDLPRDLQRLADRQRAAGDSLGEVLPFDQLHHQRGRRIEDAVYLGDVRMIE